MKTFPVALGAVAATAMLLSGCVTTTNLQTPDADLARQIMVKHCMVGQVNLGVNGRQNIRVGSEKSHIGALAVNRKRVLQGELITVHSVQERKDSWVVADASSQGVRDNLYFNRTSGEYACSSDEWRAVDDRYANGQDFETTPMISR